MARVVQRRGGPPYMLILLAFLFLVSTTLAVLFYVRNDENAKKLGEEKTRSSGLVKESSGKSTDIKKLVRKISGRSLSPDAAIKEAELKLKLKHAEGYGNLSSVINALNNSVTKLKSQIEEGKLTNDELRNKIAQKDKAINDVQTGLMEQLADVKQKLTDATGKFEQGLAANKALLDKANAEFKEIVKQKDQRISALAAELDSKEMEIQRIRIRMDQLLKIIRDMKGKTGDVGELLVRKSSGKVAKVFLDRGICYIGLGRKDRVTAGLPFSVFSAQSGVPKDEDPKAKIVIVNVGETTSECRIVESKKGDPIIDGDLLVNLIFSPTRTYNFVVEGEFDLYGTGTSDPLANRRVRAMIERFGGKVADMISVDTDFVVMGNEPPRPPKPADGTPPAVWKVYEEKMKAYDYYRQVRAIATSLQIPVLNTNRFLAFSGYVPKKRLMQ